MFPHPKDIAFLSGNKDGLADSDQIVKILTRAFGNGYRLMGINIEERPNTIYLDGSKAQVMLTDGGIGGTTCCMEMGLVLIPAH